MTHQKIAVAVYDALPRNYQDFLKLSDLELHYYARTPDQISGDNILVTGGCALEEAHAHSHKMKWDRDTDTFEHLDGSVATAIAQTPRLARNACREGKFDEAREHIGKLLHYAVDAMTLPHLTRELTSEDHKQFETDIAHKINDLLSQPGPLPLPQPGSLYDSTISCCEDTVRLQLDKVKAQLHPGHVTDDMALCKDIVMRCASFTLAAVLYVWKYLEKL